MALISLLPLIDWEKPLLPEASQDPGHFIAPTTTFWKTDVILSPEEMQKFTREYIRVVAGRRDTSDIAAPSAPVFTGHLP